MSKPKLSRAEVERIVNTWGVPEKAVLVGIRGYYLGADKKNNRGSYDDAIFFISPKKFDAFRANTDPSVFRKGIATLKKGLHYYHKGKHKNKYWALRLVGDRAKVTRDGKTGDLTGIALNIHKGGVSNTFSEGCQTIQPGDWTSFINLVYEQMDAYNQHKIPYILIEETDRRNSAADLQPTAPPVIEPEGETENQTNPPFTDKPNNQPPIDSAILTSEPMPTVEIEQIKPEKDTKDENLADKIKASAGKVKAWMAALPAAILSAVSAFWERLTSGETNLVYWLLGAFVLIVVAYFVFSFWNKRQRERDAKEVHLKELELKMVREGQAHELQLETLRAAANPNMNNVRIVPQPILNSDK